MTTPLDTTAVQRDRSRLEDAFLMIGGTLPYHQITERRSNDRTGSHNQVREVCRLVWAVAHDLHRVELPWIKGGK
jgi:hypothetical protein